MSDKALARLPNGWAVAPLAMVTDDRVDQRGPSGEGEITYLDISSVDSQSKKIIQPKRMMAADAPSRARQNLKAGDVLVSMTRPNLNAVAIVGSGLDGAVGSTGFHVLRGAHLHPSWLFYVVQTRDFIGSMCALVQGALYPAIRPKDIERWSCPIPPQAEQRRITDFLDELFSDLDAGITLLTESKAKLARYRAAVLKAAVDGSLTADWRAQHPTKESGADLLTRILAERRRRWEEVQLRKFTEAGKEPSKNWKEKYPEPVRHEDTPLPPFPTTWAVASMDQLTTRITSGSRDWQQYYDRGTGTFVMAQNVRPGRLDMDFRQRVDPPADDSSCERSLVMRDDLLVTIVGANTGDVCRVPDVLSEHYVCQSVALMRPVIQETSPFLDLSFNSVGGGQFHFKRYLYGAGRPHLSFDQLKMTPVVLPPLAEQHVIVERVEAQLSVIDHLDADLDAKLANARALRQSILRSAFAGELVPQDPRDEPASELLKRIAAERQERAENAKAAKKSRSTAATPRRRVAES